MLGPHPGRCLPECGRGGGKGHLVIPGSWSNTHPLPPSGESAAQTWGHNRFPSTG